MGTLIEPVPVTGFAANFSPMPRMAPPPLGSSTVGAATMNDGLSLCSADESPLARVIAEELKG
jgi:hypothetical protein